MKTSKKFKNFIDFQRAVSKQIDPIQFDIDYQAIYKQKNVDYKFYLIVERRNFKNLDVIKFSDFRLTWVKVNDNCIILEYKCFTPDREHSKFNLVKLLESEFNKFTINFFTHKSQINIEIFDHNLTFYFTKLRYKSFDDFINDILKNKNNQLTLKNFLNSRFLKIDKNLKNKLKTFNLAKSFKFLTNYLKLLLPTAQYNISP